MCCAPAAACRDITRCSSRHRPHAAHTTIVAAAAATAASSWKERRAQQRMPRLFPAYHCADAAGCCCEWCCCCCCSWEVRCSCCCWPTVATAATATGTADCCRVCHHHRLGRVLLAGLSMHVVWCPSLAPCVARQASRRAATLACPQPPKRACQLANVRGRAPSSEDGVTATHSPGAHTPG